MPNVLLHYPGDRDRADGRQDTRDPTTRGEEVIIEEIEPRRGQGRRVSGWTGVEANRIVAIEVAALGRQAIDLSRAAQP